MDDSCSSQFAAIATTIVIILLVAGWLISGVQTAINTATQFLNNIWQQLNRLWQQVFDFLNRWEFPPIIPPGPNPTPPPGPNLTPVPTTTPVTTNTTTIQGVITDGFEHRLGGVLVHLWALHTSTPISTTQTGADGSYVFQNVAATEVVYRIEVVLQDYDSGRGRILVGDDMQPVRAAIPSFMPIPGVATITKNIDFASNSFTVNEINERFKANLPVLASLYAHTAEVGTFARNTLQYADYVPPERIQVFCQNCPHGIYRPPTQLLQFNEPISSDAPTQRMKYVWHENFHYLMQRVMPQAMNRVHQDYCQESDCNFAPGVDLVNHRGIDNSYSGDSWLEGWAEFWPCVMENERGLVEGECTFPVSDREVSLETNWTVWNRLGNDQVILLCKLETLLPIPCEPGGSMEEYAVASLLWDLYDPKDPDDKDDVQVSLAQLWTAFAGAEQKGRILTDMHEVYLTLVDELVNQPNSQVSHPALDQIFINHGFYADEHNNQKYENEPVGWAGKPGRR